NHVRQVAEARATPALRDGDAQQALLAERRPQIARKLIAAVDLGRTRRNPLGGEAPHLGADLLQALLEPEITVTGRHQLASHSVRSYDCRTNRQPWQVMAAISSRVDVHSQEFRDNEQAMAELAADLRRQAARVAQGGSATAVHKHKAAGKLTARERIRVLLDTGAPFLELSQLAAHGLYGGDIACA